MADELDAHAAQHCAHLSPSIADYRRRMLTALSEFSIPFSIADRYAIYNSARIPESVYKELDMVVFHQALSARHNASYKKTD